MKMGCGVFLAAYLFLAFWFTSSAAADPEPFVYLTQTTYEVSKYIGDVKVGSPLITIPIKIVQESKINSSLPHFGITGFFSDDFAVGRRSGVVSVAKPVEARIYTLTVSCFFDITFANGTQYHNTTRATLRVAFNEGVSFNQSLYSVVVDADASERSVLFDFGGRERVDSSVIRRLDSKMYTRTSNPAFGIRPNGQVFNVNSPLEPKRLYAFSVYLDFSGVDYMGNAVDGTVVGSIHINTLGCRSEDGGSHVWPTIHPCGIATANCSDYDDAFDNYGLVRRQCTKEGKWLGPDFSQCRMKEDADPFMLVWVTYRSSFSNPNYIARSISVLQGVLSDYPVTSIDIHHSKRSMVTFGLVESYKVTLNSTEPLRDTILSSTWQFLNSSRAIWFRSISSVTGSFGVLGFKPADHCIGFNRSMTALKYQSICSMSNGVPCDCQVQSPFQPDRCCTAEGKLDKSNKNCTNDQPTSVACTITHSSFVRSLKMFPTSRSINIDWVFSAIPDSIIVTYSSKVHEGQVTFAGGNLEATRVITGLLPSTIYTVSVLGRCAEDPSIPPARETDLVQTEDDEYPIAPFQLRFTGVSDCDALKTLLAWGTVQDSLVSLLSHGCLCNFDTERMSGLSIECPTKTSATLRGWIYGERADPAIKYTALLQQSADNKAQFTLGEQKLTLDPTCSVALASLSSPSCDSSTAGSSSQPGVAPLTSSSGTSLAGTVVGIVIGVTACILLAVILIVLIAKYKGSSKRGGSASPIASVSLSEAKQMPNDDEEKLHEDF